MAYDLYVVTDEELSGLIDVVVAKLALEGGADVIQLRDKKRCIRDIFPVALKIKGLVQSFDALFIVNDRLDLALGVEADGVHLGQGDLPLHVARKIAPEPFIIGISVGSLSEAVSAEKDGASYIAVSPVFSTKSKDDAGPGLGLSLLREIRTAVSIPVIGIGGIGPQNVEDVIWSGADGVAVISAVLCSPDITHSVAELKKQVIQAKIKRSKVSS